MAADTRPRKDALWALHKLDCWDSLTLFGLPWLMRFKRTMSTLFGASFCRDCLIVKYGLSSRRNTLARWSQSLVLACRLQSPGVRIVFEVGQQHRVQAFFMFRA